MNKLGGFAGNILFVDLSNRKVSTTPLPREWAEKFVGGSGISARLAWDHIPHDADAFSPENALIFDAGPLVGTLAPSGGRTHVFAKSPNNNTVKRSGGGQMGWIKFAGYDNVVITGKSDRPVCLEIGDEVKFHDAGHLWGKDTWDTVDAIWGELGSRKYTVATIGPAGENLVMGAAIVTNKYSLYGRGGMGAVMGSKNLKAIAAYGSKSIKVADPNRFADLAWKMTRRLLDNPRTSTDVREDGWDIFMEIQIEDGTTWRNFEGATLPDECRKRLRLKPLKEMMGWRINTACMSCPVGCKPAFALDKGPLAGFRFACGSYIRFPTNYGFMCEEGEDWANLLRLGERGIRLGMDIWDATLIAAAIDLYKRGFITKSDTGGKELDWNVQTVRDLLDSIALRRGIGDILADGPVAAAQRLGPDSEVFLPHCKGMTSWRSMDPRNYAPLQMLTQSITTDGRIITIPWIIAYEKKWNNLEKPLEAAAAPRELVDLIANSRTGDPAGEAALTRFVDRYGDLVELLGVCSWDFYLEQGIDAWSELYTAATGIETDAAAMYAAIDRDHDLRRALINRDGVSRKDDTVPAMFSTRTSTHFIDPVRPPIDTAKFGARLTELYKQRGWDPETGTVPAARVAELTK